MIRFLLRHNRAFLSRPRLSILVIYDGTKSIAANHLYLTSVSDLWQLINAATLGEAAAADFSRSPGHVVGPGDGGGSRRAELGIAAGLFGILCLLLGRRKKPLIGLRAPSLTPNSTCPSRDRRCRFDGGAGVLYCAYQPSGVPIHAGFKKVATPTAAQALPGRAEAIRTAKEHFINHRASRALIPRSFEKALFGLGCFWGAERKFWELGDGIHVTAVGYAGGMTPNPTYEEVCSGRTGHNEVVLVVYDPKKISYEQLLKTFWESHDLDARHAPGQRYRHPVSLRHLYVQ